MLHYIVFPYVCDVALEVFRALFGTGARWGEWGALGNDDRGTMGNGGLGCGGRNSIPLCSDPILKGEGG